MTDSVPTFQTPADILRTYLPLIMLTAVAVLVAVILTTTRAVPFMNGFMGMWLCLFALLRLFDVKGFAQDFAQYDVITNVYPPYAYAYPYIELLLGLYYFSGKAAMLTDVLMIVVASSTLIGASRRLMKSGKFTCACMGTTFKMPLGAVTVIENGVMIVMALIHLMWII
jgi:hypothetical protein